MLAVVVVAASGSRCTVHFVKSGEYFGLSWLL